MTASALHRYEAAAAAWLPGVERHWQPHPEQPDAGYFGTGTVAIQSLEAVAEYAYVCATLGGHPRYRPSATGMGRDQLVWRALAGLRFLVGTHRTGALACVGGGQWGGDGWTPVPAFFLWLVAEALGEALPASEAAAVRRVLADEADANRADQRCTVLEHHGYFREVPPIPTGRFGTSWPESNAWRGALLAAARLALPDHPHAALWDDSLQRHFINALSVPQDAMSDVMVDGRPVRERFVGANVHPHFALEHHGFFHPCYAARTMQFMVLAAHAFERHGRSAPACTAHHLLDEWGMLRRLILWQGRLAYPAGHDHHRYGWGMTYLLPVLAWLHRRHGDAAAASLEEQLADLFLAEQRHNGDGSFVRERMGALLDSAPGPQQRPGGRSRVLYFRAEADPPFYLLLAGALHEAADALPLPGPSRGEDRVMGRIEVLQHPMGAEGLSTDRRPGPLPSASGTAPHDLEAGVGASVCGTFEERDAGLVLRRDAGRFASWSWNAYPDGVQGLFIPRGGDHLAEWNGNLVPALVVQDAPAGQGPRPVVWRHTESFDGGFATLGEMRHAGGMLLQHLLYVALPDGRSAIYVDVVWATGDVTLLHQEGLRLNVGNDLFNGYRRRLRFDGGDIVLVAGEAPDPRLAGNTSPWLLVDDLLGVQFLDDCAAPWTIRTFPRRNATDMSAWYAILCRPLHSGPRAFRAGDAVQRTCVRLVANVSGDEWVVPASCTWSAGPVPTFCAEVGGLDGRRYRIGADWSARSVEVQSA